MVLFLNVIDISVTERGITIRNSIGNVLHLQGEKDVTHK